jgi:hypothetical protein
MNNLNKIWENDNNILKTSQNNKSRISHISKTSHISKILRFSNIFKRKYKKVVYTAITGNYDELITPEYINIDWDYICFTDNPKLNSEFWQIRRMDESKSLDPVKKARKYKIQPHQYLPEYQISLWIDGNYKIVGNINDYIKRYSTKNSMMCLTHPHRNCLYQEAKAVIELKKDTEKTVSIQTNKYMDENYPKNNGMIASGILYRKHNDPKIKELMDEWWNEVKSLSPRDQLSFNYVCWKKNFHYDKCNLNYQENEYFKRTSHKKINP